MTITPEKLTEINLRGDCLKLSLALTQSRIQHLQTDDVCPIEIAGRFYDFVTGETKPTKEGEKTK